MSASGVGSLFAAMFEPTTVALVGASSDPNKNTGRPQRFLRKHGYAGRVVPINPRNAEVQGSPAFPSLDESPGRIEHALIMVPRDAVLPALEGCARRGVAVATVYSDGYADAGPEGLAHQERLVARANELGVRLIGPNSMGVISVPSGLALSVNAALETPSLIEGHLSVVSQSGTVLGTLLSRGQARGFGFARLVSVGNEADVKVGEIVDLLVDDECTQAIALFLETFRDARALGRAARRALAAGKPVVAYKLGQSQAGQALARSHTGAITGGAKAASAFLRAHGIVQVEQIETLLEVSPLLRGHVPRERGPCRRRNVAVVSTTGGGAGMVVDRLGSLGVQPIGAPTEVVSRLRAFGIAVSDGPVIDLTMAGARGEVYGAALDGLLQSPECDAVVAVVGSSAQFHADVAVRPILERAGGAKPLAAFFAPQADESLRLLADAGVAAFRTPEACADGTRALLDWQAPVERPPADDRTGSIQRAARELERSSGSELNEASSLAVLSELGIPVARHWTLAHPLAGALPDELDYPLALKVLSRDLAHKSDAGCVALNVADETALRATAAKMADGLSASYPDVLVEGYLAQTMCHGLAEVLLGYRLDPEVGPLITLGVGGVLAEIYNDVSVRVAPVDAHQALAMIDEVKGLAPLRGYRGSEAADLAPLAQAIANLSVLCGLSAGAGGVAVLEAEINPLIVGSSGVVAVDALITLQPPGAGSLRCESNK